jgi:hypothetical protein
MTRCPGLDKIQPAERERTEFLAGKFRGEFIYLETDERI